MRARSLLSSAGALALVACNAITGLGGLTFADDASTSDAFPSDAASDATTDSSSDADRDADAAPNDVGADAFDGNDAGDAGDLTAACGVHAKAICDRIDECSNFLVEIQYGDVATCVARWTAFCLASYRVPGSNWTSDDLVACANARATEACDDLLGGIVQPPACVVAGSRPLGAPCGSRAQCASNNCEIPAGVACGTCTSGALKDACTVSCGPGLVCVNDACYAEGKAGAPCDDAKAQPCAPLYSCVNNQCVAQGTTIGAPCSPPTTYPLCSVANGLYCGSAGTCVSYYLTNGAGGPCGNVAGNQTLCTAPNYCPAASTCTIEPDDGKDCSAGQTCRTLSTCVKGTCSLPTPAACN